MEEIVKLKNITIAFKKRILFTNINITINQGDIVQIIGENGSGKSTLLRTISGLLRPKSGTVYINNQKLLPGQYAKDTGLLINNPQFINSISGLDNLLLLASINQKIDKESVIKWMRTVGLDPNNKQKVKNYSLGMNQKLGIAQALMENNKLILLDEPLNGLDKKSKDNIVNLIENIHAQDPKTTFILVSHDNNFDKLRNKVVRLDGDSIEIS